jgi:hypothetical protein
MLIWRRRRFGLSRESLLKMLRPMALSGDRGRDFGRRRLQRRTARRSNPKPKSARSWSLQRRWSSQRPPGAVREYRVQRTQDETPERSAGSTSLFVRWNVAAFTSPASLFLRTSEARRNLSAGPRLEMARMQCNAIIASPDAIYSESRHDVASPDRRGCERWLWQTHRAIFFAAMALAPIWIASA